MNKKKCSLLMSCHPIIKPEDNLPFETGVYGEGALVIVSMVGGDSTARGSDVLDLIWNKEVEETFLYLAGFSSYTGGAREECKSETTRALLKIALDHTKKEKVYLVGCSCELEKKESFAKEVGLDLIKSDDCGGSLTLGKIAAEILGKVNIRIA